MNRIPYLTDIQIQQCVYKLLKLMYQNKSIAFPIDVEKIAEMGGFCIIYEDNFHQTYQDIKTEDGFVNITEKKIILNADLLDNEGRLRFTLAHEIGHCVLHNKYSKLKLSDEEERRLELQANKYAANLLMPPSEAYDLCFKTIYENKLDLQEKVFLTEEKKLRAPIDFNSSAINLNLNYLPTSFKAYETASCCDVSINTIDRIIVKLMDYFNVSESAASIYCEELGNEMNNIMRKVTIFRKRGGLKHVV